MKTEQKEGIIIVALILIIYSSFAIFMNWSEGFGAANIHIKTIVTCDDDDKIFSWSTMDNTDCPGPNEWYSKSSRYLIDLDIKYFNILLFFAPFFVYGILRSAGVIKRLFRFERLLSRLVTDEEPTEDNNKG